MPADEARSTTPLATGILVAAAVLLFAATRMAFLSVPLERDEGEYAYIAWRWRQGDVPYRDAFDQKPPGVFAAYAAAFALAGETTEAIHGALAVVTGVTAALLALLVRRASGGAAAALATLAFVLASIDPALTATAANTEAFMLLPLVGSVAALQAGLAGRRGAFALCGALLALACWFKPVAATQGLLVLGALAARARSDGGLRPLLGRLGAVAAGALLLSAPVVLPFALVDGAWQPFLDCVLLHNLAYASSVDLGTGLTLLGRLLADWLPGAAGLLLLAAVAATSPRAWAHGGALALGWLATALLGASVGLIFRPHYLLQVVPPLAWLAGLALHPLRAVARPSLRAALPLALGLLVVGPFALAHGPLLTATPEAVSRSLYGGNPFPESPLMAAAIAERSAPDDRVLVVGSEPQVLFHARRRSATRHILMHPLLGPFADAAARQQEALAEVAAADPELVLWVDVPASYAVPAPERSPFLRSVRRMLDERYELVVLAAPTDPQSVFTFWHDEAARRTWSRQQEALQAGLHLALYRRRSP